MTTRGSKGNLPVEGRPVITCVSGIDGYHFTFVWITCKYAFAGYSREKVTKPFQLVAGHPVLDLVNTLDWRFRESGPEELLCTYEDVLRFSEQSKLITASQARRLRGAARSAASQAMQTTREFRETLARILYSIMDEETPPSGAIKKLNQYVQVAQAARRLWWSGSRLEVSWASSESEVQLPVWLLAQSASELLTSDAAGKVRACANPECRWLFLDTSKNHSRRWCDMAISGNPMKGRRFKATHRL